jgi:hypothetical protein
MPRQSGSLVRQINGHEQRTADAPGWLSGLLGLTVPPTLLAHRQLFASAVRSGEDRNALGLVADGNKGGALDHDLGRERREDHHEHRGTAIPQRAHDQPLDRHAERPRGASAPARGPRRPTK